MVPVIFHLISDDYYNIIIVSVIFIHIIMAVSVTY